MDGPGYLSGSREFKDLKEFSDQVKSAKTLVELAWTIGRAVVRAGYEKHQAERACGGYLERYEQRHGRVKLLGMSEPLALDSIYTEVRLVSPHVLNSYRSSDELHELFLRTGRSLSVHLAGAHRALPGLAVANDKGNSFLNILGAPGAGKSTFLRFVGLKALQGYRMSTTGHLLRDAAALPYRYNLLPVLLELRNLRDSASDFAGLIDGELEINGFPSGFGLAALDAGGLLVLLDGLDEVPVERLDGTIQGIRDLVGRHRACRYITSCRTAFYKHYFSEFTDVLLADFTDNQIRSLVRNWFRSERDEQLGTSDSLWALLSDPKHEATRELARTPLLATFLCLVYDDRHRLPSNRAELYGEALRILLEKWGASKRVHGEPVFPGLSTKRELLMLESIAGPSYEKNRYFFSGRELAASFEEFLSGAADAPDDIDGRAVLEEIEKRQGLLIQRANDKYSFAHLTLQEYLAACHYYKSGRSLDVAKATLAEGRWREIRLLLTGLQEPDADEFMRGLAGHIRAGVTSEPLGRILSWVGASAERPPAPQDAAARRVLMAGYILLLEPLLEQCFASRSIASNTARHGEIFSRALLLANILDKSLGLTELMKLSDRYAKEADHPVADVRNGTAREIVRKFNDFIAAGGVFDRTRTKRLHTLTAKLADYTYSRARSIGVIMRSVDSIMSWPLSAITLGQGEQEELITYLAATYSMVECFEAAERVTRDCWNGICNQIMS